MLLLLQRTKNLKSAEQDQPVAFSARVPPFDPSVDLFSVSCSVPGDGQALWTRRAVVDALLGWHAVMGAAVSATMESPEEPLDPSIIELSHERTETNADGTTTPVRRVVRHLFVPEESAHAITSLDDDWQRFLALHPRHSAQHCWELYRQDVNMLVGHLAGRATSPNLRAAATVPRREAFTNDDHIEVHHIEEFFIPQMLRLYLACNDFPLAFHTVVEQTARLTTYWEQGCTWLDGRIVVRPNTHYIVLEYLRLLAIVLRPIQPVASRWLAACFPNTQCSYSFLRFGFFNTRHRYSPPAHRLFTIPPPPITPHKMHRIQLRRQNN